MVNSKQEQPGLSPDRAELGAKKPEVAIEPGLRCSAVQTQQPVCPKAIVESVARYALALPCLTEGLEVAYSPNHTEGMTTRAHIEKQLVMLNHYVGSEMKALSAFGEGDYEALAEMVKNPNVPEALQAKPADLKEVLEPMRRGLTASDWKVLSTVAAFHDIGKIDPQWASQNQLDLQGVEFIAHDFDSETLLENNPVLLEPLRLEDDEREKVLTLSRLHSLPGQFFFGEGNISAYNPLFRMAGSEASENVLKLARIHGVLDVMSALNQKFVKPILNSHLQLRSLISEAYEKKIPLGMKFRQTAMAELEKAGQGFVPLAHDFGLGPVALQRLRKLTSPKLESDVFARALKELEPTMIYEFQEATDSEQTWFGTYVANAFGGGILKATKETDLDPAEAVKATVKMVACAARYKRQLEKHYGPRREWALAALEPSLEVAQGPDGALRILEETQRIQTVEQGVRMMTTQLAGLKLRGGHTGIEIGFK